MYVGATARMIRLPSGLTLNLVQVSRIAPGDEEGKLVVHFSGGDIVRLDSEDAEVLRRLLPTRTLLASNATIAIFWIAIVAAMAMVYLSVRR
jgi:hypothetical protein